MKGVNEKLTDQKQREVKGTLGSTEGGPGQAKEQSKGGCTHQLRVLREHQVRANKESD
jgi:hypothetical protein